MTEPTPAHGRELGDYASLARRRWPWITGAVVVGLSLAGIYLTQAAQTYVSTSKVLVESTGSSSRAVGERTNDEINLDTEAQLVQSEVVSTRAAELLGSTESPVALANHVTVTVPPNTTVMVIAFSAPTADEARRGASAFADAYLEARQDTANDVLATDVKRLEGQVEQITEDIQDTGVAITRLTGPKEDADRVLLEARRTTLQQQLASYNAELAPMIGAEVDVGEVIVEAQQPKGPADPNPMLILPAGLMAGIVIGLGLAVWRERVDKRIHTRAEVQRLFGLVPLSTLTARGRGRAARIDHDVRACYHSLRANGPDGGEVALLVGPDAGDTTEYLSSALALIAARSGSPTVYLTRPESPVLDERRDLRAEGEVLALPNYAELGVTAEGEFRSAVLREALSEFRSTYDFLILGLPNDDPSVDLPILGRHVDIAVVVVRLGVTRRDSVAAVLADLTKSGVKRVLLVTVDLGRYRLRRDLVKAEDVFGGDADPAALQPVYVDLADVVEDRPTVAIVAGDRS